MHLLKKTLAILAALTIAAAVSMAGGQTEKGALQAPVDLIWYHVGPGPQPDAPQVWEKANAILQKSIGARIKEIHIPWGDYDSKMSTVIASGETYDICFTCNWTNLYNANAPKGAYVALDDLLPKYAPDYLKRVPEKYRNAQIINGKSYAMINYQLMYKVQAAFLPAEAVKALGWTKFDNAKLEDLEPFLEWVKINMPDKYPFRNFGERAFWEWVVDNYYHLDLTSTVQAPAVVRVSDKGRTIINQYETAEFRQFCELMRSWKNKGYIKSDNISITDTASIAAADKIAIDFSGIWRAQKLGVPHVFPGQNRDVYDMVLGTAFAAGTWPTATMNAVSITSKHQDKAVMFLNELYKNVQVMNLISWGIEGEHYTVNKETNEIVPTAKKDNYFWNCPWEVGSAFFDGYGEPGTTKVGHQMMLELNDKAVPSPLMGFAFDTKNVEMELGACKAVSDKYLTALSCAAVDVDQILPQFINELKAAGSDKIIAEAQKQVNTVFKK